METALRRNVFVDKRRRRKGRMSVVTETPLFKFKGYLPDTDWTINFKGTAKDRATLLRLWNEFEISAGGSNPGKPALFKMFEVLTFLMTHGTIRDEEGISSPVLVENSDGQVDREEAPKENPPSMQLRHDN
jgi:hypothetical protein